MDLSAIAREVEAGLPNERVRLDQARANIDFLRGNFDQYSTRPVGGAYQSPRYQRNSLIMQRVINVLTSHLYAKGPAREFPDQPDATAWLQAQYKRAVIDATMQEADRLSLAADVAAVQVAGTGNLDSPVRFQLWSADQFMAWLDPTDPTKPIAVATQDFFDNARRLRVWTADTLLTYATDKLMPGQTAGGTAYHLVNSEENYYGCIPFAFVHANAPSTDFWSGGPGDALQAMNDFINYSLTDVADSLRYAGKPIIKAYGVGAWKPPTPYSPGDIWYIPPAAIGEDGAGQQPDVGYLQSDPSFIEAHWSDLQSFIDHVLETLGVPSSAFRMEQAGAKSGIALITEQLPVILWATNRQRPFGRYEADLARVTLTVGSIEHERLGGTSLGFNPSLADTLTLRWPAMSPDVPLFGADQRDSDSWDLAYGLTSRIQLIMRRFNMTREAARAHLEAVAVDVKDEETIGLPPIPEPKTTLSVSNSDNAGEDV